VIHCRVISRFLSFGTGSFLGQVSAIPSSFSIETRDRVCFPSPLFLFLTIFHVSFGLIALIAVVGSRFCCCGQWAVLDFLSRSSFAVDGPLITFVYWFRIGMLGSFIEIHFSMNVLSVRWKWFSDTN